MNRVNTFIAYASFLLLLSASLTTVASEVENYWPLHERQYTIVTSQERDRQQKTTELQQDMLSLQQRRQIAEKHTLDYQRKAKQFEKERDELSNKLTTLKNQPLLLQPLLPGRQSRQQILQKCYELLDQNRKIAQANQRMQRIINSLGEDVVQLVETNKKLTLVKMQKAKWDYTHSNKLQDDQLQAAIATYKAEIEALRHNETVHRKESALAQLQAEHHHEYQRQLLDHLHQYIDAVITMHPDLETTLKNIFTLSAEQAQQMSQVEEVIETQYQVVDKINRARRLIEQLQLHQANRRAFGHFLRTATINPAHGLKAQQINRQLDQISFHLMQERQAVENLKNSERPLNYFDRVQQSFYELLIDNREQAIEVLAQLENSYHQFDGIRRNLQTAVNRYLFWSPDCESIGLKFFAHLLKDINKLHTSDYISINNIVEAMTSGANFGFIFMALLLIILGFSSRHQYQSFLSYAAMRVGKVHQDKFSLTFLTVLWSFWISLPFPTCVAAIGYCLKDVNEALGEGVMATVPLLWVLKMNAQFSHPCGIFIKHFDWNVDCVVRAVRYYALAVWLATPLIMMTITFSNLDEHKFAPTLGRLSFILFCTVLIVLTWSLQRAGVTFYLTRGKSRNFLNHIFWLLLIIAPLLAINFSALGYLIASQQLLWRLEMSVAIWFGYVIVYYTIRRWMFIQRRRIAFDRAKQRRADQLAQRARFEEDISSAESLQDVEEQVVDLDTISARSLRLLRSTITMATLMSLIWLWSEIHPAFSFLETVHLWSIHTVTQGAHTIQHISLGHGLIALLVLIVTTQLIRNLPALLELTLLQHLDLAPGTGYAITTLTKYVLTFIGVLICISLAGIDWPKIQWVATGLGVGLGFGLKDIFANFISGLILLFEKPLRIGDTVTVRGDLSGTVTRISTRATVITDWDRKEVIIPNHLLITEQFVNWTLSDSITRIILQVPAPAESSPNQIVELLEQAVRNCTLVLDNPPPEIYLANLEQGTQCFEIRVYTAEMKHRMPLRHELHQNIIAAYNGAQLILPYPPTQIRVEPLVRCEGVMSTTQAIHAQ